MQSLFVLIVSLSVLLTFGKCTDDEFKDNVQHRSLPKPQGPSDINVDSAGQLNPNSENGFGIFESAYFWNVTDKPVMANGHVGFVPYGDSIFMNGLYNGRKDDSHRARIQNYANVQFYPCTERVYNFGLSPKACKYALDIYNGIFRTKAQLYNKLVSVEHIQYAHRYYETAIVNHIKLKRTQIDSNGKFIEERFYAHI